MKARGENDNLENHVLNANKQTINPKQQEDCYWSEFSKWKHSVLKIIIFIDSIGRKQIKYWPVSDFKDW